jgi:hypothetical protein
MKIDPVCPVCNRLDEDGGHLFLKCKLAKSVWRMLKLSQEWEAMRHQENARGLITQVMQQKEEKRRLIFIMMWFIWSERNLIREEGRRRPIELIARMIRSYVDELEAPNSKPGGVIIRKVKRWERPPEGMLKLNCDASFYEEGNYGGWGFIIRDSDGDVVLAGWGRVNHLLNPLQAEIIACLQGVQAASNLGIAHLFVETDAVKIKQGWESNQLDLSATGYLMEELKSLTSANFIRCVCVFMFLENVTRQHMFLLLLVWVAQKG